MFARNFIASVAELRPFQKNARTHSDHQINQIVSSIKEFGFTNPVLVDENHTVIAGHGRLLAAQRLGLGNVPAIALEGLTDAQKAAYRIADNKLALNAAWDDDLLRSELIDLRSVGFDLALTGFGDDELSALFAEQTIGLTDPDDVPEPPAEPVSRLGDVWMLGRHRLVCGDATSEVDVSLCLAGVRPHLMVTDPPYGTNYDPTWRSSLDSIDRATNATLNDDRGDWREAWLLFSGDVAYVWHAGIHGSMMQDSLAVAGFAIRSQIIWVKPHFAISRGDYHVQHEPCFYAVRKQHVGHWNGDRKQSTIWEVANNTFQGGKLGPEDQRAGKHSTQKPVECMRRPIENNSSPGQAVYDPFVGSGTTIVAAEMTGRACHAIEISPAYCDVAVLRWQQFTGQTATRADGTPYGPVR